MKKNKALYIALLLLPLAVVAIASSPNSVMVIKEESVSATSFMVAIEGSPVGWCAPVTVLLNYAVFAMAVIYGVSKKAFWVKGIYGASFAAMFLGVLPIITGGDMLIFPNVFVSILLGVETILAKILMKKPLEEKTPEKQGNRLQKH